MHRPTLHRPTLHRPMLHRPMMHRPLSATAAPRPARTAARYALPLVLAALVLVSLAACQPKSPQERVAAMRGDYSAELNSFNVVQTPMVEESDMDMATDEAAAPDAAGADEAAADEATGDEIVEEVPMRQDVNLDVVVRKVSGSDRLPGITLDVYQVDADEHDKTSYRIWVDTSTLNKGSRQAVSYVLEDVDYAPGDKFAVEVRPNVPPELYGQYREFEQASAGEGEGN